MKTTTSPKFIRTALATFESASRPGVSYEIRMGADANVYCTCPAWKFQRKSPIGRTCKHLQAFAAVAVLPKAAPVKPVVKSPRMVRQVTTTTVTSWSVISGPDSL